MGISALIPCFNVGSACVPVIRGALDQLEVCVVVDDGSSDDTARQAESAAGDVAGGNRCTVLRHERNMGKGAALLTGFRYLMEKVKDVPAVITLDGDGQHDPSLIPQFREAFQSQGAELVYGNRMSNPGRMPWHRRQLNAISSRLVSGACGQPVFDSQCGYRLYSTSLLAQTIDRAQTRRYELETELLVEACRRGFRVAPVPIPSVYSKESSGLSHHNLADVLRIGKLLLRYR